MISSAARSLILARSLCMLLMDVCWDQVGWTTSMERLAQLYLAVRMMRLAAQMAASKAAGDTGGGRTLGVSPSYTSTKGRSSPKAASSS